MTGLYVVAGGEGYLEVAEAAAGEADFYQLREKGRSTREVYERAVEAAEVLEGSGTSFVVNDSLGVALAAGADGLHLGWEDLPVEAARQTAGCELILGRSNDTVEQAEESARYADYVSIGPVFPTDSKPDVNAPVGLETVTEVKEAVEVPVVAIGGIDPSNAAEVAEAGADYVAVLSAVSEEPERAIREMLEALG